MDRFEKANLRLAVGMGLAVLIAYGAALPVPFAVCVMVVILLCKPGPPMPIGKGIVTALVLAALLTGGVLMVPVLENYAFTGIMLTAAVLYGVFLLGMRGNGAITTILALAFVLMPVAGVAEQALVSMLAVTLAIGVLLGVLVGGLSHALFPDSPAPPRVQPPAPSSRNESAHWIALRATLIVMPVFVLALTNPSLYVATIMKTVALSQQAEETSASDAGRELVGSTLMGALLAAVLWMGLSLLPNLWMLMLWMMPGGALDRRTDVWRPQIHSSTVVLEQCAHHRADSVRPGDRRQRRRQERAAGFACSHCVVRCRRLVRLGNDLRAGTLAQRPPSTPRLPRTVILGKLTMTLINFFVGLPAMLLCLIVQATISLWSVRHFVRQTEDDRRRQSIPAIHSTAPDRHAGHDVWQSRADLAVGCIVRVSGRVRRAVSSHLSLGRELYFAGLWRCGDECQMETPRTTRSHERCTDAWHERCRVDGDSSGSHQASTRCSPKVIVDEANDKVVGAHMIGPDAPEILQIVAVAVKAGMTKAQFDECVAIHPTMAEELVLLR